jgi:Zn-dependent protease with chaperone function
MQLKKYLIAIIVVALVYLGISYAFSRFFDREFDLITRLIVAFAFGIVVTLFQIFISKRKRR